MKTTKRATFIFRGLGFPIKLVNAPLRKMVGEWTLDVNFNKLQLVVLEALLRKSTPLSGDEIRFMRKYLTLSTTEFGKIFGVSHVTVVKWESEQTRPSLSTDVYIRLYIFDHLKAKDKDFRNLYHAINPEVLSKSKKSTEHPLVIKDFEELQSA
jgi:DNA-binding transcriptional regulator YiaG